MFTSNLINLATAGLGQQYGRKTNCADAFILGEDGFKIRSRRKLEADRILDVIQKFGYEMTFYANNFTPLYGRYKDFDYYKAETHTYGQLPNYARDYFDNRFADGVRIWNRNYMDYEPFEDSRGFVGQVSVSVDVMPSEVESLPIEITQPVQTQPTQSFDLLEKLKEVQTFNVTIDGETESFDCRGKTLEIYSSDEKAILYEYYSRIPILVRSFPKETPLTSIIVDGVSKPVGKTIVVDNATSIVFSTTNVPFNTFVVNFSDDNIPPYEIYFDSSKSRFWFFETNGPELIIKSRGQSDPVDQFDIIKSTSLWVYGAKPTAPSMVMTSVNQGGSVTCQVTRDTTTNVAIVDRYEEQEEGTSFADVPIPYTISLSRQGVITIQTSSDTYSYRAVGHFHLDCYITSDLGETLGAGESMTSSASQWNYNYET